MGKGLGKLFYYGLGIVIVGLLIRPILLLAFGDGGILFSIREMIASDMADLTELGRIITMAVAALLCSTVIITPTDSFKSPLHFALVNLGHSVDQVSSETDQEKRKAFLTKAGSYAVLLAVVFVVYWSLITLLKNLAMNGDSITILISNIVLIVILAWGNSAGVSQLEEKNGVVTLENGNFTHTAPTGENNTQNKNDVILVIILIIANLVLLGIGQLASVSVQERVEGTVIGDVLNGETSGGGLF